MRKIFTSITTFAIALIVLLTSAQASTGNGLKAAFDEFNYALTIEWDQRDEAFLNNELFLLTEKIKRLKAEGLSEDELLAFALREVGDPSQRLELDRILSTLSANQISEEEAFLRISDVLLGNHSRGASWSPTETAGQVLVVTAFAYVAFTLLFWTIRGSVDPTWPKCIFKRCQ